MSKEHCQDCRYWSEADEEAPLEVPDAVESYCRRFPPSLVADPDGSAFRCMGFTHPVVMHDHWCGEFKAREGGDTDAREWKIEVHGMPAKATTRVDEAARTIYVELATMTVEVKHPYTGEKSLAWVCMPTHSATLKDFEGYPVTALGLSTRATNCLRAHEINTVGEIYAHGRLLNIPNLGLAAAMEISDALVAKGLPATYHGRRPRS